MSNSMTGPYPAVADGVDHLPKVCWSCCALRSPNAISRPQPVICSRLWKNSIPFHCKDKARRDTKGWRLRKGAIFCFFTPKRVTGRQQKRLFFGGLAWPMGDV